MSDRNWQKELEPIIRHAGGIVLSFWGTRLTHMMKGDHGFATEADLASEKYLTAELKKLLPEASIVAEENGKSGPESGEYQWVIDPLDGTTNFAHGIPYFCISVALCHKGTPIVGITYDPIRDELFCAQAGKGATLNGQKITVTPLQQMSKAVVACSLPYGVRKKLDTLSIIQEVVQHTYGVRHYGAAALDLAYVAAGRFDGLILVGLAWWDVAAGVVLIQEAGGMATDFAGNPITPDYSDSVAGGEPVFDGLRSLLARKR